VIGPGNRCIVLYIAAASQNAVFRITDEATRAVRPTEPGYTKFFPRPKSEYNGGCLSTYIPIPRSFIVIEASGAIFEERWKAGIYGTHGRRLQDRVTAWQ